MFLKKSLKEYRRFHSSKVVRLEREVGFLRIPNESEILFVSFSKENFQGSRYLAKLILIHDLLESFALNLCGTFRELLL